MRLSIAGLLEPRTVAVFGASDDRGKWGGRIMHYLALHGFPGDVIPINPRRQTVQNRTCYPSILDAPKIDVAVIAVPGAAVLGTVRDCAAAGVGACVIISSGFAETGEAGRRAQDELVAIAQAHGMRLLGPNCMGLINIRNGMALTSARVLDVERVVPGHIGLISQSGALMLSVYNRAHDHGIGFSQLVSVGNQADLDLADFLEHMIADPVTRAICLHVEGVTNGRRLISLLRQAHEAGKPVVVLKTGRSAQGEAAAHSHTASLAGAYAVFAAACRDAGAVLVDDPDIMVLAAHMLLCFGPRRRVGIGVISSSGGLNGVTADRLADLGLVMTGFDPATKTALAEIMLPTHLENPVDLGARRQELGEGFSIAEAAAHAVGADPNVGVVLVPMTTAPNYEGTVSALVDGLDRAGKPFLFVVTPGSVATGVRLLLRERKVVACDRLDDGLRTLGAYLDYHADPLPPLPPAPGRQQASRAGYLSEPEAKALLSSYGIAVGRDLVVRSREEAAAAAEAIGYPVVLKGVSDRVVHKSDHGLVQLNLTGRASVEQAFDAVMTRLASLDPAAQRCLIARMERGALELILGAKWDLQFGATVLVGAGGVFVDLLEDVQVALAPLSHETALAVLHRLHIWPLLDGFRGRPKLDAGAVADTLVGIGQLAASLGEQLLELDINPLLVRERGGGVVAVDARALLAPCLDGATGSP